MILMHGNIWLFVGLVIPSVLSHFQKFNVTVHMIVLYLFLKKQKVFHPFRRCDIIKFIRNEQFTAITELRIVRRNFGIGEWNYVR